MVMRFSSSKFAGILFIIAAGVLAAIPRLSGKAVMAQTASQSSSAVSDVDSQLDPYQRSGLIYYNKLLGKSGWERGQHIYYLKCWICHNEYAIDSDMAYLLVYLREKCCLDADHPPANPRYKGQ